MSKSKNLFKSVGFNWSKVAVERDFGGSLHYDFEINPEEFLDFAQKDFKGKGRRGLVNSLSNSKRAIDSQVDKIFYCLGISPKNKKFPAKVEILGELGVIAPNILTKITKIRNYLEHEYVFPDKNKVEDAIDIAALFVEACNKTLQNFQQAFAIGARGKITVKGRYTHGVAFRYGDQTFELIGYKDGKRVGEVNITNANPEYKATLRLAVAIEKNKDIKGALKNLQRLIGK